MSIKKDALEYAKAKLNYGEGAGLLRRKIGAKLAEKLKDEKYRLEFEKELEDIDMSKIQESVDNEHRVKAVKDAALSGLKTGQKVLAGLGITAFTAVPLYLKYRKEINSCVKYGFGKVKETTGNGLNFVKGKIQDVTMRFKKKQEPIFYKKDYIDRIDQSSINRS